MSLLFQEKELSELMQSFYVLTGIKIVLFDKDYKEIISYPQQSGDFCSYMRKNKDFDMQCRVCDNKYCKKCNETKSLHVYKCHAGLTEAIMPVIKNNKIIGYMIFGQIHDRNDKAEFERDMQNLLKRYGIKENLQKSIRKIKYKSKSQIFAASTILKTFVEYIQIKEIVRSSDKFIITKIENFINEHIDEDLSVARLCDEFGIKRTRLYELMSAEIKCGIAAHIKEKRLDKAKNMVKTTDLNIVNIANSCGFSDYNYFLRLFKKKYGISPKQLKKQQSVKNA